MSQHTSRKTRSEHGPSEARQFSQTVHGLTAALSMPNVATRYSRKDLERMDVELHNLIALVRGIRNAKQLIHSLPPEILASIFSYCQVDLPDYLPLYPHRIPSKESPHRSWLNLLHVSRHWRAIIARSPQLWGKMDLNVAPRMFLSRSADAPLIVYAGIREPFLPRARLLKLLGPHTARIEQLHISCLPSADAHVLFQSFGKVHGRAQRLTSLTVDVPLDSYHVHNEGSILPALFNDQYPSLRRIAIRYFTPSYSMRNLTHVVLFDQPGGRESLSNFLTFLEFSPRLEELSLVSAGPDYGFPYGDAEEIPHISTVSLPRLRELMLGMWSGGQAIRNLLSRLALPASTKVFIWGLGEEGTYSDCLPIDRSNLANFRDIEAVSVIREPWPIPVHSARWCNGFVTMLAVEDFTLYLRGALPCSCLLEIIDKLDLGATVNQLNLKEPRDGHSSQLTGEEWNSVFRNLRSLETVVVLDYPESPFANPAPWIPPPPGWHTPPQPPPGPSPSNSHLILEALTPKKEGLSPFSINVFALNSRGRKKNGHGSSSSRDTMTIPCPLLTTVRIHHDHMLRMAQLQSLVTVRGQCGYKLEELELVHHETPDVIGRGPASTLTAFAREDVRELEKYVTDISVSRRAETKRKNSRPPPGPFSPPVPYPPPLAGPLQYSPWASPIAYYATPSTSVDSLPLDPTPLGDLQKQSSVKEDTSIPLLPPSWPTDAMKWICARR